MESPPQHPTNRPRPVPPPPGHAARADRRTDPVFPETTIQVTAWPDPVLDNLGHDPRSPYVERFWLPILGPSCLLLIRRLANELDRRPDGFRLNTAQWAPALGLGMKGGRNGPMWRSLERACRFGAAQRNGDRLAVRRRLPPLTVRQIDRLPDDLADDHARWAQDRLDRPRRPNVTAWSDRRVIQPSRAGHDGASTAEAAGPHRNGDAIGGDAIDDAAA